jgi:DNA-binding transcriptional ArsR family regulator
MVEYNNVELTKILKAMSDATRRSLLTQLCQQGAMRVTELSNHYEMSLNAISKHIKVLEKAELIKRTTIGRTHLIEANLTNISLVEDWFKELKSIWELRLDALEKIIGEQNE